MSRALLVTGATGKQGGAVVTALLASSDDFHILAVTRDTKSASAQKLVSRSSKITLVQGDLDDADSIFETAKKAAGQPIWGVFSVQVSNFSSLILSLRLKYPLLTRCRHWVSAKMAPQMKKGRARGLSTRPSRTASSTLFTRLSTVMVTPPSKTQPTFLTLPANTILSFIF